MAAGAKIAQSRFGEAVTRNNNPGLCPGIVMRKTYKPYRVSIGGQVLVPAPAVIPAPIAYIKVAAVKKLVVEILFSRSNSSRFLTL